MTNISWWEEASRFLSEADEEDYIEDNGRTIVVVNMIGGRYLCYDENMDVVGVTDDMAVALGYVRYGVM